MKQTKVIAVISVVCACVAASSLNAATLPAGTTITVSTVSSFSSKTVVGRSFEAKLAQDVSVKGTRSNESRKQSVRKDRDVPFQSAQKRSPHSRTDIYFGERPQRRGENECIPAWQPADDRASGAVWPYSRHVNDYPWNLDAVPAASTSDVVAAARGSRRALSQVPNGPPE